MMNNYLIGKAQFLGAKVLRRIPCSHAIVQKYNYLRHKRNEKILLKYCQKAERGIVKSETTVNQGPIWLFWWQGEENMPLIIKKCVQSIRKNANGHRVVLITQRNLENYFIPSPRIKLLKDNGRISMAHFSDVIRFNLLRIYGGLWLDATIFVTKPITSEYFSDFFTCSGFPDDDYFFVTQGNWCSFLMGGSANNPVFQFMSKFYTEYWGDNDGLIDYFIIDYALKYAWERNLGNFKSFTLIHKNDYNPHMFYLSKRLNKSFNKREWIKWNKDTSMFKLTYKMHFKNKPETFYKYIIGGL